MSYEQKTFTDEGGRDFVKISRSKMKFKSIEFSTKLEWLDFDLDKAKDICKHLQYLINRLERKVDADNTIEQQLEN